MRSWPGRHGGVLDSGSLFILAFEYVLKCFQLVEAIRLLATPEDLPPNAPNTRGLPALSCVMHPMLITTPDIFDISSHISDDDAPDLVSALEDNMKATRNLVTKFVSLGSGSQLSGGEAYARCQKMQTEVRSRLVLVFAN